MFVDSPESATAYPADPSVAIDHLCRVLGQYKLDQTARQLVLETVGLLTEVERGEHEKFHPEV